MGLIDYLAYRRGYVSPEELERRTKEAKIYGFSRARSYMAGRRGSKRIFDAAKPGRLTADWSTSPTTADYELNISLRALRARSRSVTQNTPQGKRVLSLYDVNVIGPEGFNLQNRALLADGSGQYDKRANEMIEEYWKAWSKPEFASLDGTMSFLDQSRLYIRTLVTDGETLTRKFVPSRARNPFGFTLQWLEADHLDETKNEILSNGNTVVMSIEHDPNGVPVRYYILRSHPGAGITGRGYGDRIIVPAGQVYHIFPRHRASQSRGVPFMHAVLTTINMRGGYREAALVAARAGAAKMGFFQTESGDTYGGEGTDEQGNSIIDADPGSFYPLKRGETFQPYDPTYPSGDFDPFVKSIDRETASGADISYHSLTGDLSDVNYSSIRTGTLEMRDIWRAVQKFTADHLHSRVFSDVLWHGLVNGQLPGLSVTDFARLNRPSWHVRGWAWVDPLKEVKASREAISVGLSTLTDELGKQGLEFEEQLKKRERELELLEEYPRTKAALASSGGSGDIINLNEGTANDGN